MSGEGGSARRRGSATVLALAALVVCVLAFGELGHLVLKGLRQTLAHHLFHIVFSLGSAGVFSVYLVRVIRRNGMPVFLWRLRLRDEAPRRRGTT